MKLSLDDPPWWADGFLADACIHIFTNMTMHVQSRVRRFRGQNTWHLYSPSGWDVGWDNVANRMSVLQPTWRSLLLERVRKRSCHWRVSAGGPEPLVIRRFEW